MHKYNTHRKTELENPNNNNKKHVNVIDNVVSNENVKESECDADNFVALPT